MNHRCPDWFMSRCRSNHARGFGTIPKSASPSGAPAKAAFANA